MNADGTTVDRAAVLSDVMDLVNELADDWEFDGEVTPETFFIQDLGLESLDLVVLGTSIQYHYGRLPFAEYLAELGQRPVEQRDVTIADVVEFIVTNVPSASDAGALGATP